MATGDVQYGVQEWAAGFPPEKQRKTRENTGPRVSPMQEIIDKIEADETMHGKVLMLANYGKDATAASRKVELTAKYGNAAQCKGWVFKVSREDMTDGSQRSVLLARFTPDNVVEGAYDEYIEARKAKAAKRKNAE